MRILNYLIIALMATTIWSCTPSDSKTGDTAKYNYETVPGDPLDTKIYTLDNGLKVFMSVNRDEPRVVTQIAVRTGSKQDPSDATGLAHYLEHMLFKGTSKYGTKNWEKEKVLIDQISDLYEEHRNTTDEDARKDIYAKIDSISGEAAQFAIANEYDKMIGSLGAQGTNAYTWYEQTVYINDIPSNELEKWAKIESERFSELVLRLFHTELEAVYEEFNRTQDSDSRKAYYEMMRNLFPTHQYGTQTTIGTSEHLKNPSMVKIHEYFKNRYLPNNMAIILSGDIDPDESVALIEKYFGDYKSGEIEPFEVAREEPISAPVVSEVTGVQPEFVTLGYRLPGAATQEALKLRVFDQILSNGRAGLIDLNLEQKQKVLSARSSAMSFTDYSVFTLEGTPREGQDLDEVARLLLDQIELIKAGKFDDWMVEAVVNDLKLSELRRSESNWARASKMVNSFVYHRDWADVVSDFDEMEKLSKDDIVAFANKWFGDNYVQVNKRYGKNTAVKVEKPAITPVDIDRDSKSEFYKQWDTIQSGRVNPVFVDYKNAIKTGQTKSGLSFSNIENNNNDLFSLHYILDMGSDNDKEMAIAIDYLPYLGTSKYTPEELQKELFKLGVSFDVYSSRDQVYVTLRGLNKSLEEGTALFEEILRDVQPDQEALDNMVSGILKKRQDDLRSKGRILFGALASYAQYGPDSPFRNKLSTQELNSLNPENLTKKIRELTHYKHRIFYYGPMETSEAIAVVDEHHKVTDKFLDYPKAKEYIEKPLTENQVYFADYDMVQSEMLMLSKGPKFDVNLLPEASMFNQYFGSGLSSIVFQEIRESKALAYSAYSFFSTPRRKNESHYVRAYIGAQVDKLPDATHAMLDLMNNLPKAEIQFESARDAAMKQIETNRTSREGIFWSYENAKRLGLDYDRNKDIYEALKQMSYNELSLFFNNQIKGNNYTYCVIGNKDLVDHEVLKELGEYRELTLEELFGYAKEEREEQPARRLVAD